MRHLAPIALMVLSACTGSLNDLTGSDKVTSPTGPDQTQDPAETTTAPPPTTFLVFGDTGDCRGRDAEVAARVAQSDAEILFLGDAAYPDGSAEVFDSCFLGIYREMVGRFHAVPGDNDYKTPDASEFYRVFGAGAGDPDEGWFEFSVGNWQIIGLNANCEVIGGCREDSPQYAWLASVLAESPDQCRIVLSQLPRFTSSANYDAIPRLGPMYDLLYAAGTDIWFAGNSHHYERFARLGPDGSPADDGIRNITVGTGGAPLTEFAPTQRDGSEVRNNDSFGFLELTLRPGSYEWTFVTVNDDGTLTDSGSSPCVNTEE